MKYKGKELKEANGADYPLGNPPKKMLVWTGNSIKPIERDVLGFYRGLWLTPSVMGVNQYAYAAEIPAEEETLLTNRELAKWLAQGNGQVCFDDKTKNFGKDTDGNRFKAMCSAIDWTYFGADDFFVTDVLVRKWDDTEWHKPTREYAFGEEDK